MRKILQFIWRHKLLTLVSIIIVFLALFLSSKEAVTPPFPSPVGPSPSWDGLTPGISSENDVIKALGEPILREGQSLEFKSTSATRNHQAVFSEGNANFLKEVVTIKDPKKIADLTSTYGKEEFILYGEESVNGFNLFAYPSKGIAYLGNPITGELREVWYFVPVDKQTFLSTWAKGYSETSSPVF